MIKRIVLMGLCVVLFFVLVCPAAEMAKLNIVVRDPAKPCAPYANTRHNFFAAIFHCDGTPFLLKPLTGIGPAGGRIYGQIEVPPGAYIVIGIASCKNVLTDYAFVVAGCCQEVCVNLLPRRFERCVNELIWAIKAAQAFPSYSLSSPEKELTKELKDVLLRAQKTLGDLAKLLPAYPVPFTLDEMKLAQAPEEIINLWQIISK